MKKFFIAPLAVFLFSLGMVSGQNDKQSTILVLDIKDAIDPRMSRLVRLALEKATDTTADILLIEMDTYGGALTDADDIRTMLLEFKKPTWVFINRDAASAGALISIACDSIYMASGASIGAATVVTADGSAAPDKYQSYMKSIMRSTAEAKGRNPQIAEAMVDQEIEIEGITEKGNVITFSTSEAIQNGFCEGQRTSIDEIIQKNGISNYNVVRYERSTAEKIIAFFLNPFVSGILLLVIVGGIYFELQTPGVGFPILAAGIALLLYLTPYYLNGLAENWEILMFFAGIGLLVLEIFVIPGFGIAGILGIIFAGGSLVLVMLNNDFFDFSFVEGDKIVMAVTTTLGALIGSVIVMFIGGVRLTNTKIFKRISLQTVQDKESGYTSRFVTTLMTGKQGTAFTILRPSGKVLIDGEVYDAFTRGEYIEKDAPVIVVDEEGTSLKVKAAPEIKSSKKKKN
ncbi:MAG TPA: NfeD family protein [Cyclobacteriaceae bacterium]|jgi:membrane-bound serine protease (ClpP class)